MSTGSIRAQFANEDAARQQSLDRARLCASVTKPWVLPELDHQEDQELAEPYQSIGSRGITNLEGKMLLALYPPDAPWFSLEPTPEAAADLSDEELEKVNQVLFERAVIIQAVIESSGINADDPNPTGFRTAKRKSLSQLLITGDTLERLHDDFQITVYRRDQYTTRRDTEGRVLWHCIREQIHPDTLTDAQKQAADLTEDKLKDNAGRPKMLDLYTRVSWNHRDRNWTIEQEVNEKIVNRSVEPVSPYISTPFELVAGEHYGRGFVEQNLGDLRSYDKLEERLLDFAAMASKHHPAIDHGSDVQARDLEKPTGTVIRCRVQNGQVQDVGILKLDKITDFQVVFQTAERKRGDLGAAMLVQSASVRDSERTTATEVTEVTIRELEGALGGFYAPIADSQQMGTVRRVAYVLERDKKLPPLRKGMVRVNILTGLAALARERRLSRIMGVLEILAKLGEAATARINLDVLIGVLVRYAHVIERGLIKTKEQVEEELRRAMAAQAEAAATEQAIKTTGAIVENAATAA